MLARESASSIWPRFGGLTHISSSAGPKASACIELSSCRRAGISLTSLTLKIKILSDSPRASSPFPLFYFRSSTNSEDSMATPCRERHPTIDGNRSTKTVQGWRQTEQTRMWTIASGVSCASSCQARETAPDKLPIPS